MRRIPPGAPILTTAQMRAAEAAVFGGGVSQDDVMERAGTAIAREVRRLAAGRPILVLAGPGNNGGDAYVAARLLAENGADVTVGALGAPKSDTSARMAERWRGSTTTLAAALGRPILLDGLLGIGTPRPFEDATVATIARLRAAADLTIAIDVPSGIDADSGEGGIGADVTIALGALKPAHVLGDCGHVILADIGTVSTAHWSTLATPTAPAWRHDVNKFSRGMVLVVGGAMAGAGWLAAGAALRGGAGYVTLSGFSPETGAPHALVRRRLETVADLDALLDDDRVGAVVVGPGLGRDARAATLLDAVLASDRDLVLDGDALTLLGRDVAARIGADRRRVCLTPHSGEFDRMFAGGGDKITRTLAAAASCGAVVVHKGAATVIADPDGRAAVGAAASPWLSTAGSGDVLAGLVAARLSAKAPAFDAACAAVWLHTRAAAEAGPGFTADALIDHIPEALAQCRPT